MTYEIYDNWYGKVTARGLTYREAKDFLERNEPPLNCRVGFRYSYWRESPADAGQPTRNS